MSRAALTRSFAAVVAVAALSSTLVACGGSSKPESSPSTTGSDSPTAISADRCADNKAAGTITYMTGYFFQASASILEVAAADKLGYFSDECLTVKLQGGNGDTQQQEALLASGKVQLTSLGEQDVIEAAAKNIKIKGISSYSNAGLDILMTDPSITDLRQLDGKKIGYKYSMPIAVTAMLAQAGVDADTIKKNLVSVGNDTNSNSLVRGRVAGLTGFVSNEPLQLEAAGHKVTVWQPSEYGVPSSLGAIAVNPAFAEAHPTAVQDFLRAVFKAYQFCAQDANVQQCLDADKTYAGTGWYGDDGEKAIWQAEVGVVAANPLPGGFGSVDLDNVGALATLVDKYADGKVTPEQAQTYFDTSFVSAIMKDGNVIWPAP